MKLNKEIEEKLKSEAIKQLKNGRPDWDIPHTLLSVGWMRKLIEKEGGNERILITAMYLHDIGCPRLQKGYDFDDMIKSKKNHAEIGAVEAKKILRNIGVFSDNETSEICKLIKGHYEKDNIDTFRQQLVIEADGLAKIDWERITPNFDKENCFKYLDYFKGKTVPKFRTKAGKKFLKTILEKAENYWK